jgi:DNA-binding SARP family transcriptional activator
MVRLRLLGALDLVGPGSAPPPVDVARRSGLVGLLAYLALGGRAFCSRDTVQAIFWPEHDHRRARHNLNQWLYTLRRALGRSAIVSRGPDAIGLEPAHVWCDAAALVQALDGDDHATALHLYAGDLLPGFHLPTAPPFQDWLDTRRDELRRRTAMAALDHAAHQKRLGHARHAMDAARRAAELTRDEIVVQAVIRLLDRLGDRAAALDAFHTFRRRLESDLGIDPSPETLGLVRAVAERATPHPARER